MAKEAGFFLSLLDFPCSAPWALLERERRPFRFKGEYLPKGVVLYGIKDGLRRMRPSVKCGWPAFLLVVYKPYLLCPQAS
ncbi:MAG: hypothetical protein KHW46_02165 [Clostridiales bacterium]|nr:hypothetical protein [Clostridiales bacterium]